jgi:trigger factor
MQISKIPLEKGQVELTISVETGELEKYLRSAANRLTKKNKVPGFRPGKMPFEMVKNQFGEMALYQEAADEIITQTYYQAITQEKIEAIGQPKINIEKLAPQNPVVYKAIVNILPTIILGDWQKLKIKKKKIEVTAEDIEKTLAQLQELNVKEVLVDRAIEKGDKAEIDFVATIDKVAIEGGTSYKYPVVIGANRMIPGFEEKLLNLKKDQEIDFSLQFPEKYFQKNLIGKSADFHVKIISVFERQKPELNDELAKNLGFDSLAKLNEQLKTNIGREKENKEQQRVESEAIQEIIKTSTVTEIPEMLIDEEIHKMIHELEHSVNEQGLDLAGYLKSINKTHEDLHTDFKKQATERIKAALILRQIALDNKIEVPETEIKAEIEKQAKMYQSDPESLKQINSHHNWQHLANVLTNQKVIKFITDTIIK